MPVCGEDGMIKVCNADSTTSAVKWTLRKYIELQRIYPSKLRLYCVERITGKELCVWGCATVIMYCEYVEPVEDGSSGSESRRMLASRWPICQHCVHKIS